MTQTTTGTAQWLDDLRKRIESHTAVNHPVLSRLETREEFLRFGLQHHALVGFFTRYMELLLLRAPSSREKLWLAKVLLDEYGEGSEGKDHATLYRDFLRHAGAEEGEEARVALCEEVFAFIAEHLRIASSEPFLTGLGALGPGHEWAIPTMFSHIVPALRRAGMTEEQTLYFSLHCEQDIDHGRWMTESLLDLIHTDEDRALVERGAELSLAAREKLWDGIGRAIDKGVAVPASGHLGDLADVTRQIRIDG